MTYADIVKELHSRSGLGVKEYAEAVNLSVATISNIINGKKATMKAVDACLRYAQLEDRLELPDDESGEEIEERKLLRSYRKLNDERRKIVLGVAVGLLEAQRPSK